MAITLPLTETSQFDEIWVQIKPHTPVVERKRT